MKKIIISFVLMMFSLNAEQFKMTGKLIKAKISYQNLNRISVRGDKIDTLVGIDTAFHFEKNEKTGEVFIRPTEDNGYNPISISVTTTSGKTQDLLLEVVNGEANSIELISESNSLNDFSNQLWNDDYFPDSEEGIAGGDYEENISAIMKKFINLPSKYKKIDISIEDRNHAYVIAKFQKAYRVDGFLCLKFQIVAKQENYSCVLDERMFSRKGDIALSLSTLHLGKNRCAALYVLRR